jgi:hypothetical protein
MRNILDCDYDKKYIAVIIGDTDTPLRLTSHDGDHKTIDMTTATLPPGPLVQ